MEAALLFYSYSTDISTGTGFFLYVSRGPDIDPKREFLLTVDHPFSLQMSSS